MQPANTANNGENRTVAWFSVTLFALSYFGLASFSKWIGLQPQVFVCFWLPSGFFVGALLLSQTRHWPWYVVAAFLANILFDLANHHGLGMSFLFTCGNCLEAVVGAWMVRLRIGNGPVLASARGVVVLIGWSALLSTTVSATVGASVLAGFEGVNSFVRTWLLWWSSDALGVLLVAPFMLAWRDGLKWFAEGRRIARTAEAIGFGLIVVVSASHIFREYLHPGPGLRYVVFPCALWAAVRFGSRGAAATHLALGVMAAWIVGHGHAEFAPAGLTQWYQVLELQLFLAVLSVMGMVMSAILEDRARDREALRQSEARFRTLVEHAKDAVFVQADYRFAYANQAALQLLGARTPDQLLGQSVMERIHPEYHEAIRERIRQMQDLKLPVPTVEQALVRLDGTTVPVEVSSAPILWMGQPGTVVFARDITERKQAEQEREITTEVLRIANSSRSTRGLVRALVACVRRQTGVEAVGVRLREGDDYPYYESSGFPDHFLRLEHSLCARDEDGRPIRDATGQPVLECMCGNVICGRFDPSKPFFTSKGSFWTNNTTQLLASTTEADRKGHTRNRCPREGYLSVALFPLRSAEERLGLLQLNDRRPGRFTPEFIALWERLADYLAVALSKLRADEAVSEAARRLRLALRAGGMGTWDWDLTTGAIQWSDEHATLFGLKPGEFGGSYESFERSVHPDDRPGVLRAIEHARDHRTGFHHEFRVVWPDGSIHWVRSQGEFDYDAQGRAARMRGVVMDITESKDVEAALREGEQRFRLTFDQSPIGAAIIALDFRFLEVNTALCRITGYTAEELTSLGFPQITHPDDLAADVAQARRLAAGEIDRYEMEKRYLRKDGGLVWGHLSVGIMKDSAGKPLYYLPTVQDITKRKQAEEELRTSREQLRALSLALTRAEQQERRHLAVLLHDDVIQSLALIRIQLGGLRAALKQPEHQALIGEVRSRLEQAIERTRFMSFQLSPPILHELGIEAALDWLAEQMGQQHGLRCSFVAASPRAPLDTEASVLLFAAVRELLLNVVKHARAANARVTTRRDGDTLHITVEDDGAGFEPTTLAAAPGRKSGFGLLSIRERLGYLGGRCELESAPGRGTRVLLSAPVGRQ